MFAACSKDGGGEPETPPAIEITAGDEQTIFADQTEAAAVSFTAAGAWTATVEEIAPPTRATADAPEWISINPASGAAGNASFAITLQENASGADRAAKITIASSGDSRDVTLTQKATTADGNPYEKKYDVYVVGARKLGSTAAEYGYWKNGAWRQLTDGGGIIQSVASGNDLYFLMLQGDKAKVWKNGGFTDLEYPRISGGRFRIAVSGSDVYAVETDTYFSPPAYWKNKQKITLPLAEYDDNWLTTESGAANTIRHGSLSDYVFSDIFADGGNVLLCGEGKYGTSINERYPVYYHNGAVQVAGSIEFKYYDGSYLHEAYTESWVRGGNLMCSEWIHTSKPQKTPLRDTGSDRTLKRLRWQTGKPSFRRIISPASVTETSLPVP
jgi:hypothetical protein